MGSIIRYDMNRIDQLLTHIGNGLHIALGPSPAHQRPTPAQTDDALQSDTDKRHAAGLMRINHTGEVCAQALYSGQAFASRSLKIQQKMQHAADEELDHLAWCSQRLEELNSHPSRLNLLWYGGSWLMGAAAGLAGDRWNLGFLEETERQVEAHLGQHLDELPAADQRSREIVAQMKIDEAQHAQMARDSGATDLPAPVKSAMAVSSNIMKWLAYRV